MRRTILATALLTTLTCTALVDLKPVQSSGISSIGRGLGNAGAGLASGNEDKAWGWFLLSLAMGGLGIAVALNKPNSFTKKADSSIGKTNYKEARETISKSNSEAETLTTKLASSLTKDLPTLTSKATVVMTIQGAPITIEVDGTNAPITVGNFIDLVQRGVYDGLVFHRVVRQPEPFVVQGGDPQSKDPRFPAQSLGTGGFIDPNTGNERTIPLEITPQGSQSPLYSEITSSPKLKHTRGAVAMARSQSPDSASSQFYIALADLAFLDGSYAVFGNVTSGMDVVDKIQQGDRIDSAKVTS